MSVLSPIDHIIDMSSQKLVLKEANRLTGVEDVGEGEDEVNAADGSDAEAGEKKKKAPNMTRLLKSRLQKLVEKTDDQ